MRGKERGSSRELHIVKIKSIPEVALRNWIIQLYDKKTVFRVKFYGYEIFDSSLLNPSKQTKFLMCFQHHFRERALSSLMVIILGEMSR